MQCVFVDGHAQIYRAIFSPISPPLVAPDGTPTSGVFVFFRWLLASVGKLAPDYFAMAVDTPRHFLERRKMYGGYKRKRPPMDENVTLQAKIILRLCRKMGFPVLSVDGWEADDVLATLATKCLRKSQASVTIVGRDKDLHQVLSKRVELYDPQNDVYFSHRDVMKKWGVPPKQVVEVQTLAGDPRDDVPGAPGIGLKKATALIQQYGTVAQVLATRDQLTPGLQKSLANFDHELSRMLVQLRIDLKLGVNLKLLRWRGFEIANVKEDLRSLGIHRLLM